MWPIPSQVMSPVIDLTTFEEVTRIPTTTSPLSPQLQRGKLLVHLQPLNRDLPGPLDEL